jgi:SAM-dependent methyltransferase
VNALPGDLPVRDVMTNHRPEPKQHPGIVVVGDYLFDSTLNGLLDSSDAATDIIVTEMMRLRRARSQAGEALSDKIDRDYFDNYRGLGPYREVWSTFTDPAYLTDLIKIVWGRARGYKLLVAGSASGELVGALRERGIDAWGIENNRAIHARTPKALKKFNKLGSIVDMPFKDGEFDFVFETSLCHIAEKQVPRAVRELNRVMKTGLLFGSVTSDMAPALIDRYDLGVVLRQWVRPLDASPRRHRCVVGGDARRQQGAGAVVRGLRQPALFVLRQGGIRELAGIRRSLHLTCQLLCRIHPDRIGSKR